MRSTLELQIDHTVGKNLHGWKNDVDNGTRATEMCPDIKAIGSVVFSTFYQRLLTANCRFLKLGAFGLKLDHFCPEVRILFPRI